MSTENIMWSNASISDTRVALDALGYSNLTEFLRANPACPYDELAARLGIKIAPIQLIGLKFREARANGDVRFAAMDCLCRNIVEKFPDGWGLGEDSDGKSILALSGWSSEVKVTGQCEKLHPLVDAVMFAIRRNSPPIGWKPTGPDDSYIRAVFEESWPTRS